MCVFENQATFVLSLGNWHITGSFIGYQASSSRKETAFCGRELIRPWLYERIQSDGTNWRSEYEFRVMAINLAGSGKPSLPSEPVVALDPIGKSLYRDFAWCLFVFPHGALVWVDWVVRLLLYFRSSWQTGGYQCNKEFSDSRLDWT